MDAALRILSFANQLDASTRTVVLEFEEGLDGTMGYLDRVGFIDLLAQNIAVLPERPLFSAASIHAGGNQGLVEIASINPRLEDPNLRTRLSETLVRAYNGNANKDELKNATWTIFSELIQNVHAHSASPISGYAALQVYRGGDQISVAVSDSGFGIMNTLRPALEAQPDLKSLDDTELLVEIFRQGLSRNGPDHGGDGLKGCAHKAIRYNAEMDVRLPDCRVLLKPGRKGYSLNTAHCWQALPMLWGTHICFNFKLDK